MQIGFVLFPNVTQLDFTGPVQVLNRMPDATIHVLAKDNKPVQTDCPFEIVPSGSFADAPKLDMICVPGGHGVSAACQDQEVLDFIAKAGEEASYVTSVCTGAFLLGKAGLLTGKKATTHWAYTDLLPMVGATHMPGRVVRDGNTFTGGGVTAGIDFAFTIMQEIAGSQLAESFQLALEYDPQPPTDCGHPSKARPETLERMGGIYGPFVEQMRQALS